MIADIDLRFDKEQKRYYLTENYVINKMGTDLDIVAYDEFDTNVSTLNKRTIEYACDIVYDWLEDNAVSKETAKYLPTQYINEHNALKRALKYQLFDFIQVGDISTERGNKASDVINLRAIQALKGSNMLNTCLYNGIPADVEEW